MMSISLWSGTGIEAINDRLKPPTPPWLNLSLKTKNSHLAWQELVGAFVRAVARDAIVVLILPKDEGLKTTAMRRVLGIDTPEFAHLALDIRFAASP